ncbi:MAG: ComEC/Rec2 family competence protein [Bacilli bacterium]
MKKIFNYRPIVFLALFLILGIYLGYMLKCQNDWLAILLGVLILIFLLVAFIKLPILNNKYNNLYNKLKSKHVFIIICVIFLGLGILLSLIDLNNKSKTIDSTNNSTIVGTVTDLFKQSDSLCYFVINNCSVICDSETQKLNSNILCYTYNTDVSSSISLGQGIAFAGNLNAISIFDSENDEINMNYYKYNIGYTVTVYSFEYTFSSSKNLNDIILEFIKNKLLDIMPSDNAYFAYSILFGDSSALSSQQLEAFKASGVMHIIAVSGMNIAIIIGIFLFIFSFINGRKGLKFFIIVFTLLFYCYLCSFSPSVTRATLMGIILLFGKFIGRKNDVLSSLSLSAIIILLINPLYLFEVGFLLSYTCLLGIIFVGGQMNNFFLTRAKLPNFLATSISITLSAQLGIYPVMAYFFNSFSLYSIFANLIVVPLFSVCYVLLFCFLIISIILPFLSAILLIPAGILNLISIIPYYFSELPNASLWVFSLGIFSILFYLILIVSSHFINFKKKTKLIFCSVCGLILTTYFVYNLIPANFTKDQYLMSNQNNIVYLTSQNNEFIIVGNVTKQSHIKYLVNDLRELKVGTINAVVIPFSTSTDELNYIEILNQSVKIEYVYVFENAFSESELESFDLNFIQLSDTIDISFASYNTQITVYDFKVLSFYIYNDYNKCMFLKKDLTSSSINFLLERMPYTYPQNFFYNLYGNVKHYNSISDIELIVS